MRLQCRHEKEAVDTVYDTAGFLPDGPALARGGGDLRAEPFREQGTPIPTNDLWIASLVAQYNLMLFSRDRHFDVIPQLARVN